MSEMLELYTKTIKQATEVAEYLNKRLEQINENISNATNLESLEEQTAEIAKVAIDFQALSKIVELMTQTFTARLTDKK